MQNRAGKIKAWMAERKTPTPGDGRRLKNGSYSVAMTGIVIAGAIAVNLIASELPSKYTKIDVTEEQLSVLTEQSEELLADLEEDIVIYYILQDGNRDTNVSRLLERYEDASAHVTVEERDPVLYPNFISQYTEESLPENSVIVTCQDQTRVVSYSSMYETSFDYSYYTYETTGFDAEGQITSAIAAVSSGDLPKLYFLTGHGELELSDTYVQSVEKENIETESLNLITAEEVPEDADCLLIASPTSDLSEEETEKVLTYLKNGGRAVVVTDYMEEEMPNLVSVLEYYGLSLTDGVVIEGNSNYYVQLPYYIVPEINSTEVSEDLAGGQSYALLGAAQGIDVSEELRETVTVSEVLSTSDQAYSKTDVENMSTYEKEEGDIDGPFCVGAVVSETIDQAEEDEAETKLSLFTSSALLDPSVDEMVSNGNSRLFLNTLSWSCGQTVSASVPVKSMTVNYLTVTSASGSFWSIVVIGIIPGAFLFGGLFVWWRRRKK